MNTGSTFRLIAALALLLLAAVDLVGCELICGGGCEAFGGEPDSVAHGMPVRACLCCCTHVVVGRTVEIQPVVEAAPLPPAAEEGLPSFEPVSVYHPPRV
jgi:hypothetical protein